MKLINWGISRQFLCTLMESEENFILFFYIEITNKIGEIS
jgi:hypothetical protein